MKKSGLGIHLIADYYGCDFERVNSPEFLEETLLEAVSVAGATLVQSVVHQFSPQGITAVAVVEESHFSIHTWPEFGYVAVDVFTCGNCSGELAEEVFHRKLKAKSKEIQWIHRGQLAQENL